LIIDEAVRLRASDIHIEPMTDRVRVRYRIDGVCSERDNIPKNMQAPVLARVKIMSGMDIGERRLPQDGRIKRNIDGQDIDFRVSALPAYHGESTVLRVLRPDSVNIGIQAIGFEEDNYERFTKNYSPTQWYFPCDRPNRKRQNDNAVFRIAGTEPSGQENYYRGRPGRIQYQGNQSVPDPNGYRLDV
jgi:hypothetical protein